MLGCGGGANLVSSAVIVVLVVGVPMAVVPAVLAPVVTIPFIETPSRQAGAASPPVCGTRSPGTGTDGSGGRPVIVVILVLSLEGSRGPEEEEAGEYDAGVGAPEKAKGPGADSCFASCLMEFAPGLTKDGCDDGHGERVPEPGDDTHEKSKDGAPTATASNQSAKESNVNEEKDKDEKDPSKSPHHKVMKGRRVVIPLAAQPRRHVLSVRCPGSSKRLGAIGMTVAVLVAADAEVGPLGDFAGARYVAGVGAEEVGVLQGRAAGDAAEDDEPEKDGAEEEPEDAD